jgi:hypothetical protein
MELMESNVLLPEDLARFGQHGYVRLPKAFLRADALAIQDSIWSQMREQGIYRNDRSTWPTGSWGVILPFTTLRHQTMLKYLVLCARRVY